jgi:hypothetical protein
VLSHGTESLYTTLFVSELPPERSFGNLRSGPSFRKFTCLFVVDLAFRRADHILSFQQSLAHYEQMLSQLHPTYLESLRVDFFSRAREG